MKINWKRFFKKSIHNIKVNIAFIFCYSVQKLHFPVTLKSVRYECMKNKVSTNKYTHTHILIEASLKREWYKNKLHLMIFVLFDKTMPVYQNSSKLPSWSSIKVWISMLRPPTEVVNNEQPITARLALIVSMNYIFWFLSLSSYKLIIKDNKSRSNEFYKLIFKP